MFHKQRSAHSKLAKYYQKVVLTSFTKTSKYLKIVHSYIEGHSACLEQSTIITGMNYLVPLFYMHDLCNLYIKPRNSPIEQCSL
jgi:hypothetical protein